MEDGDVVGDYRLKKRVGHGGMGEVWQAKDIRRGRIVAVKVLPDDVLNDSQQEQRFRRECHFAATIEHLHVMPVYDFNVDSRPYIVMPWIEGQDLGKRIKEGGRLAPERAVVIIEQVASALAAAHRHGVRHRDVKPSNIMLRTGARKESDHALLFDWGIAKSVDTGGFPTVTRIGQIVGTPEYMAPERQHRDGDHRADIYSLAVVLYECLTGKKPFTGTQKEVLEAHLHHDHAPPRLPPDVPGALCSVVWKGLAEKPGDRHQSVLEFADAARFALEGQPVSVPFPSELRAVRRKALLNWVLWLAGGSATGGLVALVLRWADLLHGRVLLVFLALGLLVAVAIRPEPLTGSGPRPGDPSREFGPGGGPVSRA